MHITLYDCAWITQQTMRLYVGSCKLSWTKKAHQDSPHPICWQWHLTSFYESYRSHHPFSSCVTIATTYSLSEFFSFHANGCSQLRTLKPMVDSGAEWEAKRCEIRSATAEVKTGRLKILVLLFWMGEWKRVRLEGVMKSWIMDKIYKIIQVALSRNF